MHIHSCQAKSRSWMLCSLHFLALRLHICDIQCEQCNLLSSTKHDFPTRIFDNKRNFWTREVVMVYMKLREYLILSQPAIRSVGYDVVDGDQPTAGGSLSAKTWSGVTVLKIVLPSTSTFTVTDWPRANGARSFRKTPNSAALSALNLPRKRGPTMMYA